MCLDQHVFEIPVVTDVSVIRLFSWGSFVSLYGYRMTR